MLWKREMGRLSTPTDCSLRDRYTSIETVAQTEERQNVLARAKGQQLVCQSDVAVRCAVGTVCLLHLGPLTGKHVGAAGRSLEGESRSAGGQSHGLRTIDLSIQ